MNNYFSHDSNARNSDKLIPLRAKHGAGGYGVYFMILERLREEPTYTSVKDYNMLAFDLRVDAALVKSVVEDFGLFTFTEDGKRFYSEGFSKRMGVKDEISKKARESVRKRWDRTRCEYERNTNVDENEYERNTDVIQVKKSKVKESKENNNSLSISPSFQSGDAEIATAEPSDSERERIYEIFFFEKNCKDPQKEFDTFIHHYEANGWCRKDSTVPVKDRLALARNWKAQSDEKHFPDRVLKWLYPAYIGLKKADIGLAKQLIHGGITQVDSQEGAPRITFKTLELGMYFKEYMAQNQPIFKMFIRWPKPA